MLQLHINTEDKRRD